MELSLAGPESGAVRSAGTPERFQSRETHEVRTEGGKGGGREGKGQENGNEGGGGRWKKQKTV